MFSCVCGWCPFFRTKRLWVRVSSRGNYLFVVCGLKNYASTTRDAIVHSLYVLVRPPEQSRLVKLEEVSHKRAPKPVACCLSSGRQLMEAEAAWIFLSALAMSASSSSSASRTFPLRTIVSECTLSALGVFGLLPRSIPTLCA